MSTGKNPKRLKKYLSYNNSNKETNTEWPTPIDTVNTEAETSNTKTKSKILPIFVQNVTDYKNTINCHE